MPDRLSLDVTSALPSTPSPQDQPIVLLPPTSTSLSRPVPLPLPSTSTSYLPDLLACTTTDIEMTDFDSSSPSSSPSSDISEISTDSSASTEDADADMAVLCPGPPTMTIEDAAADAALNIQYVMDKFPTSVSYVAEPFKKEPLEVEGGDRVELLEELPNFVMRVKLMKNGVVGLLPAWNMEDPFERLARLNMEFNEAVTCPAEVKAKSGEPRTTSCTLAHVHSRCQTQNAQTRREFVREMRKLQQQSPSSSSEYSSPEYSLPPTPVVEPLAAPFKRPKTITNPYSRVVKVKAQPKMVKFTGTQRKVVFRYYLPAHLNKKEKKERTRWDSDSDSESELASPAAVPTPAVDDDEQVAWWWDGWEEDPHSTEAVAERGDTPMPIMPQSVVTTTTATSPPDSKSDTPSGQDDESRRGRHHRFRGKIRINQAFKVIFQ